MWRENLAGKFYEIFHSSGAGFCYDGIEIDGMNVLIQIIGQPVYSGKNDTYDNVNKEGTLHPQTRLKQNFLSILDNKWKDQKHKKINTINKKYRKLGQIKCFFKKTVF